MSSEIIPGTVLTWDELPQFVQDALNKVASDEGLSKPTFTLSSGSNVGDGFVSVMLRVVIEGYKVNDTIDNKGVKHKLKVIVKLAPFSKARREQFGANSLFEREVQMYNEYLPVLEQYQIEKGISRKDGLYNFPRCYFASFDGEKDETLLIMEDLIQQDFGMWSKYEPMDFFHASKVMESLGRFHGLSLVIKKQKPETFERFKKYNDLMGQMITNDAMTDMFKNYFDNAINSFPETDTEPREKLLKFKENFAEEMKSLSDPKAAEPYTLVNHGDCWINNFMFKKGTGHQPTVMAFIDLQIARYASPVLDLMYFLFTSTDKSLRDVHFEDLLQIYHNALGALLRRCGEDPDKLFPYESFKQQLKDFGRFGMVMAFMVLPVISMRPHEIPDLDKATDLFAAEGLNKDSENPELQKVMAQFEESAKKSAGRIKDVVVDTIAYGLM